MNTNDERIAAALDADDRAFLDSLDDGRGLLRQYGDSFRGPLKIWTIVANIVVFVVTAIGLYAVWGFLNADTPESMLRWAALGWAGWTMQIALKQWLWDRINHLAVLREVKRLQVQVAMLGEK